MTQCGQRTRRRRVVIYILRSAPATKGEVEGHRASVLHAIGNASINLTSLLHKSHRKYRDFCPGILFLDFTSSEHVVSNPEQPSERTSIVTSLPKVAHQALCADTRLSLSASEDSWSAGQTLYPAINNSRVCRNTTANLASRVYYLCSQVFFLRTGCVLYRHYF